MESSEIIDLLRSGQQGITSWNAWRQRNKCNPTLKGSDLQGLDLRSVNLQYADLEHANLSRARLSKANLQYSNLRGAFLSHTRLSVVRLRNSDLSGADLRSAIVRGANLHGVCFVRSNLENADLGACDISDADFSDANLRAATLDSCHGSRTLLRSADLTQAELRRIKLSRSTLTRARLRDANLIDAVFDTCDLQHADLSAADLSRARFITSNFNGAIIENAIIEDTQFHELTVLPLRPEVLRSGPGGVVRLDPTNTPHLFGRPPTLEVFLSSRLSAQEVACLHLHLAELQARGTATHVFFTGHRDEREGTVLRFESKSLEELIHCLSDLLAPIRSTRFTHWSASDQGPDSKEVRTLLQTSTFTNRHWRFAERMATIFEGFHNARVTRISVGTKQAVRIDAFVDEASMQLLDSSPHTTWNGRQPLVITIGPNSTIELIQNKEQYMDHSPIVHGNVVGAVGTNARFNARDVERLQQSVDSLSLPADERAILLKAVEAIVRASPSDRDRSRLCESLTAILRSTTNEGSPSPAAKSHWEYIKTSVPQVASLLASVSTLAKNFGTDG